jgi:hypothetical protein
MTEAQYKEYNICNVNKGRGLLLFTKHQKIFGPIIVGQSLL